MPAGRPKRLEGRKGEELCKEAPPPQLPLKSISVLGLSHMMPPVYSCHKHPKPVTAEGTGSQRPSPLNVQHSYPRRPAPLTVAATSPAGSETPFQQLGYTQETRPLSQGQPQAPQGLRLPGKHTLLPQTLLRPAGFLIDGVHRAELL